MKHGEDVGINCPIKYNGYLTFLRDHRWITRGYIHQTAVLNEIKPSLCHGCPSGDYHRMSQRPLGSGNDTIPLEDAIF